MNKVMDDRLALLNASKQKAEPKAATPLEDKEENSQLILRPQTRTTK